MDKLATAEVEGFPGEFMAYAAALNRAWQELERLGLDKAASVKFLADEYTVDFKAKSVISLSCNAPAKDFTAILILHYLAQRIKGLPQLSNEWLSFKELSGVEGYYPSFRQRAIAPIIRKYGSNPAGLLAALERLPGKKINQADAAVVLDAFAGIPAMITLWRGDAEFGPEANMLFDKSITRVFCTEDIVVLAGLISSQL